MKSTFKLLMLQSRGGASTTPAAITATSGSGQSANCGAAYTNPLVATVTTAGGVGVAGVTVTFTAPASGASGTFASTGTRNETVTTNASGVATSSVFTANRTLNGAAFTVTASAGALSCNFTETSVSYLDALTTTFGANRLATYPMLETTGTGITDVSGNGHNGAYANVTLNNIASPLLPGSHPLFVPASNSDGNIFSTALRDAFNYNEFTICVWLYNNVAWNNASVYSPLVFYDDANDFIGWNKQDTTTARGYWVAGGTNAIASFSTVGYAINAWYCWVLTGSKSNNRLRAYVNNVQQGTVASPAIRLIRPNEPGQR